VEAVAREGVVRRSCCLLPKTDDDTFALYNRSGWNATPKKVKVLYVKYIRIIIVISLEYHGTREILWESAGTIWQS